MGNSLGKFSDNDPYVQTQLSVTAVNNQSTLKAAVLENNHLRASSAVIVGQAVTRVQGTPYPIVSAAAQGSIGAALSGVGQQGTPSDNGDGGGADGGGGRTRCFAGDTLVTFRVGIALQYLEFEDMYARQKGLLNVPLLSFDENKNAVNGELVEVFRTTHYSYVRVTFEDGVTNVIPEHCYYIPSSNYIPIKYLLDKQVVNENGSLSLVRGIEAVECPEGKYFYNLHEKKYQNYCADKKRVHNLKPNPDDNVFDQNLV